MEGLILLIYLAVLAITVIAGVKILTNAGYSGVWILIIFVPIVGFIMALVFAFSDWPVLQELRQLRASAGGSYGGYGSPGGFPPPAPPPPPISQ